MVLETISLGMSVFAIIISVFAILSMKKKIKEQQELLEIAVARSTPSMRPQLPTSQTYMPIPQPPQPPQETPTVDKKEEINKLIIEIDRKLEDIKTLVLEE